jgi:hypothetical protein
MSAQVFNVFPDAPELILPVSAQKAKAISHRGKAQYPFSASHYRCRSEERTSAAKQVVAL